MATEVFSLRAVNEGDVGVKMSNKEKRALKREVGEEGRTFPGKKKKFIKGKKEAPDTFPEKLPVSEEALKRHDAGVAEFDPTQMRTELTKKRAEKKKSKFEKRAELTARAEILNEEEGGFLEGDDGELTYTIRQEEIVDSVDMASASKHFDLHLEQFGPYHIDYTDNGRHLIIGGKRGHIAAFDWHTKKLFTENNVMEAVRDVKFLHIENMFAVSQKHYTYVYDNQGTELHCLKALNEAMRLEFLPKHFLLVGSGRNSWLHWLDVSIGQMVMEFPTKQGPLDVMCQNPANAIIHTGHGDGTVSLWAPSAKEPLVRMLAHPASVRGISVDDSGQYMVTNGLDRKCRIWDLRMYKQVAAYTMPACLGQVAISQKKVVACAVGNTVQMFKDMHIGHCREPYLTHRCGGVVSDLKFVPYEDVLGVGHAGGFTSVLVPGAGEANVDALRSNPYETKKQRKEREVKQLLEKLSPDMICLDPDEIARVDTETLEREEEERKKQLIWFNQPAIKFTPRHRMKGRGSTLNTARRRETVKQMKRTERNIERREVEKEFFGQPEKKTTEGPRNVLDRFKAKK